MANRQFSLIPVSPQEFTHAAYELAKLLEQRDEEDAAFDEAKSAHKETLAVLAQGIAEQRAIIKRARLEAEEGLAEAQVNLLLDQAKERES